MTLNLRELAETPFEGFRLTHLIGEGGMAVVYRGENLLNPRIVRAIKIIRPELGEVAEFRARFAEEAGLLSLLHHPRIVTFHGVRQAAIGGTSVLAMEMELLEGRSLDAVLREGAGRAIDARRASELILQAADGVAAAHALGIVHRDLKPANLFLLRDGSVKVLDFGIARVIDEVDRRQHITRVGTVPGSPPYMAPEVCNGALPAAQADVYALGITLLEMLLGFHPYNPPGQSPRSSTQMMMAHLTQPLPPASFRRSDVPASLSTAVERATAKEPSQRYASGAQFADALRLAHRDFDGLRVANGSAAAPASGDDNRAPRSVPPPRNSAPPTPGLATEFAMPVLDQARSPAERPSALPSMTEFAVPTLQKSSTTEPSVTMGGRSKATRSPPAWPWVMGGTLGTCVLAAGFALHSTSTSRAAVPSPVASAADASVVATEAGGVVAAGSPWVFIRVPSTPTLLGLVDARTPSSVPGFRPAMRIRSPEANYEIQQREVTTGEFAEWARSQGIDAPPDAPANGRLPALGVSWDNARQYCRSLEGGLPTEEQWEFAARGPNLRPHPWGTEVIDLGRLSAFLGPSGQFAEVMTSEQDVTPGPRDARLFDLAGNAREWTADLYRPDSPAASGDMEWVQANGVTFRAIRGLPVRVDRPGIVPEASATWRDALCATGVCPADTAPLLAQMGFRCARSPR